MAQAITFNKAKTVEFTFDIKPLVQQPVSFRRARKLAEKLGCSVDGNQARFLFWNPEFKEAASASLEIFVPGRYLNFDKPEQHSIFHYRRFPLLIEGEFAAIVLDDVPAGSKESFGALYQAKISFGGNRTEIIRDPLAASLPYGIFAPAEIYDMDSMLANRKDAGYFESLGKNLSKGSRIKPSVNLLEIHVQTATKQGTIHSLTERYTQIASKIRNGTGLTPDEKNLTGFDAVELMPLEPVIEHPGNHNFWDPVYNPKTDGGEVTVRLRKPKILNWGYDVSFFGTAAVNPSLLSTGRPDELLELIETLHNFPKPVKVVLDMVFGHAHDRALEVLPNVYFSGPNVYGQDIRFQHPMVRAIALELQRRKINFGFDGIRVDASQDINYYDKDKGKTICDDDFLEEMSNVLQKAAGIEYRPWMIFEDGRPWPRDDWKLACTYREVTKSQPHAFQWAPTIFAYNTPYNYTHWVSKWWRIQELTQFGEKWISGYANHDTLRRGTQADPGQTHVNTHLGNSLKMVMENAYNNPSTTLLMHGFLPGVPMDFLQALGNTPWSFIRDTDTKYALKIVAEEMNFLNWQVTENEYRQSRFFKRLKGLGFHTLDGLRQFTATLYYLGRATGYSLPDMISMLNSRGKAHAKSGGWDQGKLTAFTTAWMLDVNDYSNVDNHSQYVNSKKAAFNLEIRNYRLKNPWLINNFRGEDRLCYIEPVNGTVIYYGYRKDPSSGKEIVFVANMEGQARQIVPADLLKIEPDYKKWEVACSTPSITRKKINEPARLSTSQGLLFEKE